MTQPKDLYKEAKLDQVINSINVWSLMYIHLDLVTLRDLRILINGFSAVRKMLWSFGDASIRLKIDCMIPSVCFLCVYSYQRMNYIFVTATKWQQI